MSGNTIGMAEALKAARKTKNVTQKVEALQALPEATKQHLHGVFQLAYNPHISWLLPPGTPPYRPLDPDTDSEGRLISELKNFSYFIANDGKPVQPDAQQMRREQLFIRILESVEPEDAELVIQMKDREIKGVSKNVVAKAFPELGLQTLAKGGIDVANKQLMFHSNNYFNEQQIKEDEGSSKKQLKRTRLRKTKNRIDRALKNRDWDQLEELEGYNINVK